jgi:hypothetical protein
VAQIGLISGNIAGRGCERCPRRPTRYVVGSGGVYSVFDLGVRRVLLNRRDAILCGLALVCLADRDDLAVARL